PVDHFLYQVCNFILQSAIKIVPMKNVVINYVVQEGEGTVTNPSNKNNPVQRGYEHFNPSTGKAIGSTATPAENWDFEGWYSDPELTQKVSGDNKYVPSTPSGGWPEGADYTYYAKFVRKNMDVTVTKNVEGNMGDTSKEFSFTLTDADGNETPFNLSNGASRTFENLPIGSVITITERGAEDYVTSITYGNDTVNAKTQTITLKEGTNTITVTNSKDVDPDTGVSTDSAPYGMILGLLAIAGGLLIICRRRRVL
ncbi:MAG: DUF5979 domain-containing protein, partial [Eubacteriales bacterium]|nr:DUF5979 domain-containing protein [Eubacteriales bacterium]